MRTMFLIFVAFFAITTVTYSGIALFAGKYTATPIVNLIGPSALPSICADRSRPYFDRNEGVLREISNLVIETDRFTDIWVTNSPELWKLQIVDEEADLYENVEVTDGDIDTFLPLFNQLEIRDFNSPVLFSQSRENVLALQHASTCGPSVLDWIKFRLSIGEPAKGRPNAIYIGYVYWPDGVTSISACPEPLPEFEHTMLCEVQLNDNWTWFSRWAPEHPTHRNPNGQ